LPRSESLHLIASSGLKLYRRDYIVFMPRFASALRPVEPWLSWLPLGAQYAVLGEKHG